MTVAPRESGRPVVYLLVGLTGSGKTTYARRKLEPLGVTRLSVDELVYERHGRYGVDYPEPRYFELEAPIVAEVRERLAELVAAGKDVVLDHGLWRLLYFPVERAELLRRLSERNRRDEANALLVTESALDDFSARFDVPFGEGELVIQPGWPHSA
ncbi:ATP-binding protein [Streptomyces sp. NPDC048242]|uniref:ATP-binding protein n=1 Tax=Streptomyces sp. NPDC048242 TaxID=3155026 RepID=UPI003444CDBF